jgi:hypothetical protein
MEFNLSGTGNRILPAIGGRTESILIHAAGKLSHQRPTMDRLKSVCIPTSLNYLTDSPPPAGSSPDDGVFGGSFDLPTMCILYWLGSWSSFTRCTACHPDRARRHYKLKPNTVWPRLAFGIERVVVEFEPRAAYFTPLDTLKSPAI